jgi:hypothetical protein
MNHRESSREEVVQIRIRRAASINMERNSKLGMFVSRRYPARTSGAKWWISGISLMTEMIADHRSGGGIDAERRMFTRTTALRVEEGKIRTVTDDEEAEGHVYGPLEWISFSQFQD